MTPDYEALTKTIILLLALIALFAGLGWMNKEPKKPTYFTFRRLITNEHRKRLHSKIHKKHRRTK